MYLRIRMADTLVVYGESGSGKTTIVSTLAKWIYKAFGLTTRLVSSEGWEPIANDELISSGVLSAFNVSTRKLLLADMRKLSKGYWPKVVEEEVAVFDENQIQIGTKKAKVRRIVEDAASFSKVGMYAIETLDGIADRFMSHIIKEEKIGTDDRGKPRVISVGPQAASGRYEEDGEVFGGNSQGHYNIVQTEMYNLITAFGGLGGNVKLIIFTSHVGTGQLKGENVFAPLIVGEARNAKVPSWVGDCWHVEETPKIMDESGNLIQQREIRAWYESHRENSLMEGPRFLCKSRVGLSDIEALHEKFPSGYVTLGTKEGEGLDQYYDWLNKRKGGNARSMKAWKEEIDGRRK